MKSVWRASAPILLTVCSIFFLQGPAEASMMNWTPPVAGQVTTSPAKAMVVGETLSIQCVVGADKQLQLDTNSPQGKYLSLGRKPSWTLPVQIRVNNNKIAQFDDAGMSSLSATIKHAATWKPSAADAGKPAVVECVVDPEKKYFLSSKTVSVQVLLKPVPKVDIKNQTGPGMKAVPPSAVPATPGPAR